MSQMIYEAHHKLSHNQTQKALYQWQGS